MSICSFGQHCEPFLAVGSAHLVTAAEFQAVIRVQVQVPMFFSRQLLVKGSPAQSPYPSGTVSLM
jgi:hypothetical protein